MNWTDEIKLLTFLITKAVNVDTREKNNVTISEVDMTKRINTYDIGII